MSYQIGTLPDGRVTIQFCGESANLVALPMAPGAIEPVLNHGKWVLLLVAVWSMPDIEAVALAARLATEFDGKLQVGVRPFDLHEETVRWLPTLAVLRPDETRMVGSDGPCQTSLRMETDTSQHPIWLSLREGEVLGIESGPRVYEAVQASARSLAMM